MQEILSIVQGHERTVIILSYVMSILPLIVAYICAYDMDNQLCINHEYAENKKRIRLKCFKWLFARPYSRERREMFKVAFVHELITIVVFAIVTALFTFLLFTSENILCFICPVVCFIYGAYICTILDRIRKKVKEYKKSLLRAEDDSTTLPLKAKVDSTTTPGEDLDNK